jgi:hypothetical protein
MTEEPKNNNSPKVEIDTHNPQIVIVDGKKYAVSRISIKKMDGVPHEDKVIFKEIKEEDLTKDRETLIEAMKKQTRIEELLDELLKGVPPRRIKRLANAIRNNKPLKVHHGCLGIKVGREYEQIIPAIGF